MNGRWMLACLILGLSVSSPARAGRMVLDPGVVDSAGPAVAVSTDVMVAPAAWARLDMALGEYHVEVMSGEVTVVFAAERHPMSGGDTCVIAAGTAFGVLNTGTAPAHLRISLIASQSTGQH